MSYSVETTQEFRVWIAKQQVKTRAQVDARLLRAADHEHFGDAKDLGQGLAEFRFKSGLRIYFTIRRERNRTIIVILGGVKNGQKKDIKKARGILTRLL